eukprot:TRINITY_DN78594_c0_g1_i1.p1 TRINITY_DN78594_c0_g1~~TRINITY_DN78594_c0_g1_i1.p1  ORF type:complete len:231 (-),score=52.71 TRINITY_DN78594_c0_g1_i1:85-714(-)
MARFAVLFLAVFILADASDESLQQSLIDDEACEAGEESCSLELRQLRSQLKETIAVETAAKTQGAEYKLKKTDADKKTTHNAEKVKVSVNSTKRIASCTADDETAMNKFGPGNADGTFPKILANCGKGAYSFWHGFSKSSMQSCIATKIGISSECASCFAASGQYGYDNCKWQCLFGSWCGKGCLGCSQGNDASTKTCAGVPVPEVKQC